MRRRRLVRSIVLGTLAAAPSPGCFDQDATLGLECTTARACGRKQSCIDGTCQRTADEPQFCPNQPDIVVLESELPVSSTELLPTNALDVLGECGSLGGNQALYLWRPPVSGTFAVRLRVDQEFFANADVLPPLHLRNGGCEGSLGSCTPASEGARSFSANQDDVIVIAIDDLPPGIDPASVGFGLAIDDADYCLTGGELAPTVPIVVQGTTVGSENLLQPATCEGTRGTGFGRDVAFSWTAPREGLYSFAASSPDDTEVLLYVLAANCGGSQLACTTDRGFSGTASSALPMVRGQKVVIVVDTSEDSAGAAFELTIDEAFGCVPSSHDLGFQFPPGGLVVPANDAESTPIVSCAAQDARQLLYRWTAPAAAFYTFSSADSDMQVTLSVLEDSCSGAVVGCDEGVVATLESENDGEVTLPLDSGESVVLSAAPALPLGQVVLTLEQTPCGSQLLATPLPISEQGAVDPRAQGPLDCADNRPSPEDAVFSWRAPDDGVYAFEVEAEGADELLLYLQDGSCAGPTVACAHAGAPKLTVDLRAQDTVAVGIAAPPGADPMPYTLKIAEVP